MSQYANYPFYKGWKANGSSPAAGYYLYTYDSGTTNPKTTYSDSSLATPNSNPIILNGSGEAAVFLGSGAYRFDLKTPAGALVNTFDPIIGTGTTLDTVFSIAALKDLFSQGYSVVNVLGYYSPNDGGGGLFYYDPLSTEADNGGTIFLSTGSPSMGRWKRLYSGEVNVKWFGAVLNGSDPDDSSLALADAYIQSLTNGGILLIPETEFGLYLSGSFAFGSKVKLRVEPGGFSTSSLQSLTIPKPDAGFYKIFSGAGTVIIRDGADVFPHWWGVAANANQADAANWTSDTAAFTAAFACAVAGGGELCIPAGQYAVNVQFTAEAPVRGAGVRRTILRPYTTASPCVLLTSAGGDGNLGISVSGFSIYAQKPAGVYNKTGVGLECGTSAGASAFSLGEASNLDIRGFNQNWLVKSSIAGNFRQIWSSDGTYGLDFNSEGNITICGFDGIRIATCDYGMRIRSGIICSFRGCAAESSTYRNLWLETAVTTGPTKLLFENCWFEDLTGGSGTRQCVYFNMEPSIAATKGMDILFNRCTVSTPNGLPDIHADAAQNVLFDNCIFSNTADKFSSTKFTYASGGNNVRIMLKNCGTVSLMPTEAVYASFTALTRVAGGVFGYFYDFTTPAGKRCTNFNKLNINSDQTSLQVAYVDTVVVDTSGGTVVLSSLNGGSEGQILKLIKTSAASPLVLQNAGAGTQQILTREAINVNLIGLQGAILVFTNGAWYESSNALPITSITDNTLPRRSGATWVNSGISDDGTNISISRKIIGGSSAGMCRNTALSQIRISGGSSEDLGANLQLFGESNASDPNEWALRHGTTNDLAYDGTHVICTPPMRRATTASITASVTQTQGQQPLTRNLNFVSVCANANDVVTLPAAVSGLEVYIRNNGAQVLQIFPASGDAINGAAVDASVTLAVGASVTYRATDATNWYS